MVAAARPSDDGVRADVAGSRLAETIEAIRPAFATLFRVLCRILNLDAFIANIRAARTPRPRIEKIFRA